MALAFIFAAGLINKTFKSFQLHDGKQMNILIKVPHKLNYIVRFPFHNGKTLAGEKTLPAVCVDGCRRVPCKAEPRYDTII